MFQTTAKKMRTPAVGASAMRAMSRVSGGKWLVRARRSGFGNSVDVRWNGARSFSWHGRNAVCVMSAIEHHMHRLLFCLAEPRISRSCSLVPAGKGRGIKLTSGS
jgi:hypothetical protein